MFVAKWESDFSGFTKPFIYQTNNSLGKFTEYHEVLIRKIENLDRDIRSLVS